MARRRARAFGALSVLIFPWAIRAETHRVAITVDDLPFVSGFSSPIGTADGKEAMQVNEAILRAFSNLHVPATGFVIGQRAEQLGPAASHNILTQWTQPGFGLGNHTYSHRDVNDLSVEQAEQEITHGEAALVSLLESTLRSPKFFRFPYNHAGDTKQKHNAIAAFLSAHDYRLAPCTIDSSDYEFNVTYVLARARNDEQAVAKVRADYIAYTAAEIDWYSALNKQVFGYEPPQIMLLHDNPLNAAVVEKILSLFAQRGYLFTTLEDAVKDPAYAVRETYFTKYGPMWGYRWAQELHVKVNGAGEPDPPAWIAQYSRDHRREP